MVSKHFSLERKLLLYEQFKKTTMSKCAFAEQNGISKSAFTRWVKEIEAEQLIQQRAFDNALKPIVCNTQQQAHRSSNLDSSRDVIEVIMPNNIIIKLPITKDLQLLTEVLAAIII